MSSLKKLFQNISQNLRKKTSVKVSFNKVDWCSSTTLLQSCGGVLFLINLLKLTLLLKYFYILMKLMVLNCERTSRVLFAVKK